MAKMDDSLPQGHDDEISLLDLLVVISENWLWLVIVPFVVGAAALLYLSFDDTRYRATMTVPVPPASILTLWQLQGDADLVSPEVRLGPLGGANGLIVEPDGDGAASILSLTAETPEDARNHLTSVRDAVSQAISEGLIVTPVDRTAATIRDLEETIALRTEAIESLENTLSNYETTDGLNYAVATLALSNLLNGRVEDINVLEQISATPAPTLDVEDAEINVARVGRSPILITALAVLGSGFVMLILVFVRQGLKGAGADPAARVKLDRIRNGFLLRRRQR